MQFEVGSIIEGKVTGIKKFGAFVELPGGTTGMVHISEVSNEYINELSDHLQEGQTVKVKVLSISPEGKVALSIKKAEPPAPRKPREYTPKTWQPKSVTPAAELGFEDMMARFKQQSEEKIADIKRSTEARRGGGGGGYSHKGNRG